MRRVLWTAAILALNLIFQSSVLPFFKIRGIIPNTALVIIISFSLLRGSFEGCLTGFGAGLLQDIFSAIPLATMLFWEHLQVIFAESLITAFSERIMPHLLY